MRLIIWLGSSPLPLLTLFTIVVSSLVRVNKSSFTRTASTQLIIARSPHSTCSCAIGPIEVPIALCRMDAYQWY